MNRFLINIKRWWPSAVCVGLILYATLNANPVVADRFPPIPHLDKLIHAVMFGGLFGAICFDRVRAKLSIGCRVLIIIGMAVALFGLLTEIMQTEMHNGRSGDVCDFAADCLGIVVAAFTAPPAVRRVLKRR
ncbi:MAG: VanZ family protein [Muribaculaceae bacterium]|nr:VanZ family protein [Muribaculaceae bacterium]